MTTKFFFMPILMPPGEISAIFRLPNQLCRHFREISFRNFGESSAIFYENNRRNLAKFVFITFGQSCNLLYDRNQWQIHCKVGWGRNVVNKGGGAVE